MPRGDEHRISIFRRGRAHRARCACGWSGHAWNELRPAEADAWHHVHGDGCIVDEDDLPTAAPAPPLAAQHARSASVETLVRRARDLADGPSPYSRQAVGELWHLAGEDPAAVREALGEVARLLQRHSRRSASTADSEWLQLITAKRLLQGALDEETAGIA